MDESQRKTLAEVLAAYDSRIQLREDADNERKRRIEGHLERWNAIVRDVIRPTLEPIVAQLLEAGHGALLSEESYSLDSHERVRSASVKLEFTPKRPAGIKPSPGASYPHTYFVCDESNGSVQVHASNMTPMGAGSAGIRRSSAVGLDGVTVKYVTEHAVLTIQEALLK